MGDITIGDVPDDTCDELAARAAATGQSLQDYLRRELVELALRPDNEIVFERILERKRRSPSSKRARDILDPPPADHS